MTHKLSQPCVFQLQSHFVTVKVTSSTSYSAAIHQNKYHSYAYFQAISEYHEMFMKLIWLGWNNSLEGWPEDSWTGPWPSQVVMTWSGEVSTFPWLAKGEPQYRGYWREIWTPAPEPSLCPSDKPLDDQESRAFWRVPLTCWACSCASSSCLQEVSREVCWFCQSWCCQTLSSPATHWNELSPPVAEQITENQELLQMRSPTLLRKFEPSTSKSNLFFPIRKTPLPFTAAPTWSKQCAARKGIFLSPLWAIIL